MRNDNILHNLPHAVQWMIVAGGVVIVVLIIAYLFKSTRLDETERYSRFQFFLVECNGRPDGITYNPEGSEEDNYFCSKRGGEISLSNYAQTIDEFYDPREKDQIGLCPSR